MNDLDCRKVIVSGAGGDIGHALSIALAAAGALVVGVGRDASRMAGLEAAAAARGGRVLGRVADVRDAAAMRSLVQDVTAQHGPFDTLVNNAAVMYLAPMGGAEVDDWLEMVDVNLKGPLALIGAVLPSMLERRSGHIVNISSISARKVGPGVTVYSATKAALDTVSEGLRQEVASRGIKVTSFQLGAVDTALNDKIRNAPMRRLIKARAGAYHALPVADVVQSIVHALTLPPHVNLGQVFLAPTDQAS